MMAAEYQQLVEELEGTARDREQAYRVRVGLLAAVGYAYVVVVVLVLAWAAWLVFGVIKDGRHLALLKFAIPMGVLAAIGMRALLVRIPPPEGLEVTAPEAPKLFSMLGKIRRRVKGPAIDQVVITNDFNASIMQLPRWGLFGGARNYLVIGLPLMQTLSVEQFAAVLAHEYGHLSGAHGRFSAWIYRIRITWARILDALTERPVWGAGIFVRFFRWYVPYFEAYTFVLARANEYEADRTSAGIVGERTMADALVQVELGARFYAEEFWPRYANGADKAPRPAMMPFTQYPITVGLGIAPEDASAWLAAALRRETGVDDTHPSLKDRLAALGQGPRQPDKPVGTAARALLEGHLSYVVKSLDDAWAEENLRAWSERFEQSREMKERADQIAAKAKAGTALNGEEWYHLGRVYERHVSESRALASYQRAVDVAPQYGDAHLAIGTMLLKRRDESGLRYLDKAIEAGGDARWHACALAVRYLRDAGRAPEAEAYELGMRAQYAQDSQAEEQRMLLLEDDVYGIHGLGDKELALCRATFKRMPRVHKVYAVRKMLPGSNDTQLVLLVEPEMGLFALLHGFALSFVGLAPKEDSLAEEVCAALRLERPFTVFNTLYEGDDTEDRIATVEDALIFDSTDR